MGVLATSKLNDDFRRDVQGLRAVAVLLVVLYHARFSIPQTLEISGGFIGVDVFFVISGFVVGGALYREAMKSGSIKPGRFLARRAKRLLPALGLAVGATSAVAIFSVSLKFLESSAYTALAATFFGSNLWLWVNSTGYFVDENDQNPLIHTWSLSVEEQFYILLLIALLVTLRVFGAKVSTPRWTQFVVVTGLLFLFSLTYSLIAIASDQTAAFYSPFARAWQFLLGFLLYLFVLKLKDRVQSALLGLTLWLAGFGMIGYGAVYFSDDTDFPGLYALLPSLGAASIILSRSFAHNGPGARILEIRPLVAIGNISYSWYLWHWPLIVFADFWWMGNDEIALGAAALAIIPASMSYLLIEQPFRQRPLKSTCRKSAFITVSFLFPVLLALTALWSNERAFEILEQNDSFLATMRIEQQQIQSNLASILAPDSRTDIVIVGDSHAATFAQGLAVAASNRNQTVGVVSQGRGCLLLQGPFTGTEDEGCATWQNEALETLVSADIKTVILHGYATGRLTGYNRGASYQFEISNQQGARAETLEQALALYEEGLEAAVKTLITSGKEVVLLSTLPDFTRPLPTSLPENRTTASQVFLGQYPQIKEDDIEIIPLALAQERNRPLLEIEQRISGTHPRVQSVDLSPLSCVNGLCTQWRDGTLVYSDLDHITAVEALRLSEFLLDIIENQNNVSME